MVRSARKFSMNVGSLPVNPSIKVSNLTKLSVVLWSDPKPDCLILFDLILYVPSTIFQLLRDGSSWVKPVLS